MPCGCFCLLPVTPLPHVSSLCVFGPYPELHKDRGGGLVGEVQANTADPCMLSHCSHGDISYLREQMLVRSFLSSFSCLPELLLGQRIKFSFVVGLGENKTKCHLEKLLLLHPWGWCCRRTQISPSIRKPLWSMVPRGIRWVIDVEISLYGSCGDNSDPEQQLHPACACTEPTHPHAPCTEQCRISASPARGWGAAALQTATATDVLYFGFLPLPALLVLKLKASVCELVAVLQDPN